MYDTDRGGFFQPNDQHRHHYNGATATPDDDGSYTFRFMTHCEPADHNCLEVPEGRFDVVARYDEPDDGILDGSWTIPRPRLDAR